ncbi:MAG: SCO family protein [Hydrogenophilus sp.]|nr:SCO family protein [Hydrogenophilus sp.]
MRLLQWIGMVWCLAALGGLLAGCDQRRFFSQEVTGAGFGEGLTLPDSEGMLRSLSDFRGEVVAVYFGFIHCPDVCPTALSRAVTVKQMLGSRGGKFRVVFVTVDLERDRPEVVRAYLANFDPEFVGLIPPDEKALEEVAKGYRVFYRKVPTGASYTMDHTATTFVYDPSGRLRLVVPHSLPAEQFAADVTRLLDEAGIF